MTKKLSRYFALEEFICPCGECDHSPVLPNLTRLAEELDKLRDAVDAPVVVTSGYRCPAHNAAVGGKPGSMHMSGLAADVRVEGRSGEWLHGFIEAMIKLGGLQDGGVGKYLDRPRIVHYDIRGKHARW